MVEGVKKTRTSQTKKSQTRMILTSILMKSGAVLRTKLETNIPTVLHGYGQTIIPMLKTKATTAHTLITVVASDWRTNEEQI